MELAARKDVPVEETWDLSLLYGSEEEMLEDLKEAEKQAGEIVEKYQGKLNDPEMILSCLDAYEQYLIRMIRISGYSGLAVEVDYTDSHNMELSGRVDNIFARDQSRLSFIESEITQADEPVLEEAIAGAVRSKNYLKDILRRKPHVLEPQTEKALKALSPAFRTPYEVYNMAKLGDMDFGTFEAGGKTYPLGYSLFEDDYEYEKDTKIRRAAFRAFYEKISQYKNVTAAAYNAQVRNDKLTADLRGFDSVFDYLLFDQKVTREMYDRQIDLITKELSPYLRRYARLLKEIHGLDRMTFADLKLSVDPDFDPHITIGESKEYVKKGLAVMGDDYVEMVEQAYRERWIDFAKNQGKSTGGFCSSPYGANSFILLSWNNRMADVFTIAHELGHAGHFKRCNEKQSLFDTDVSTYFVEAPSTMNELLLANYLLTRSDDRRFRRWVLSSMIGHTYYHNFVTHLREAWYQREVYKIVDEGGSVTAEVLSDIFRKNLETFWGSDVELVPGSELTWMRQPHYYMGLYSYTYSAGLTIATQTALRILKEGQPAVDDWKKVLDAGSTLDPAGLAALAKIDITNDEALRSTIAYIGSIIDEICTLTEELDGIKVE